MKRFHAAGDFRDRARFLFTGLSECGERDCSSEGENELETLIMASSSSATRRIFVLAAIFNVFAIRKHRANR